MYIHYTSYYNNYYYRSTLYLSLPYSTTASTIIVPPFPLPSSVAAFAGFIQRSSPPKNKVEDEDDVLVEMSFPLPSSKTFYGSFSFSPTFLFLRPRIRSKFQPVRKKSDKKVYKLMFAHEGDCRPNLLQAPSSLLVPGSAQAKESFFGGYVISKALE